MFVTICNAPRFGGGMYIAPEAEMDDGLFDLVVIRSMSKLHLLLRLFPKVFKGNHVGHPAVSIHRTPWARVSFDREQVLGCDGELVGRARADRVFDRAGGAPSSGRVKRRRSRRGSTATTIEGFGARNRSAGTASL